MGPAVKRYFFALTLCAIALGALLAAKAVNRVIEARVFLDGPQVAVPSPRRTARRISPSATTPGRNDVTAILERNIFCSECPPILPQPKVDSTPVSDEPMRTSLSIQLVATMVSDDPNWSFAALRDTSLSRTGLYGVGSQLLPGLPGVEVTAIEYKRVYLANAGRPEYVLFEGAEDAQVRAPSATSNADPLANDIEQGVRKVSENAFEVDRSLIEKFLGAPQTLAKSARIVPSMKDGQSNGFRLYAIRAGSPYAKIGLMNGDTIHAINGLEITTPDKALEVYSKLRNATHITVNLTRRNESRTLDYSIR